jgi:hypothetical protein
VMEVSPWKQRQTQIDCSGIQSEDLFGFFGSVAKVGEKYEI